MKDIYDIVIVGSGMAGLYSAFLIQKFSSHSFVILEKYKKNWIGGRTSNDMFCGTEVVTGAGVVRKKKDVLLVKLLKELDVNKKEFTMTPFYSSIHPINIDKTMEYLKKEYKKEYLNKNSQITFQSFACRVLGKEKYNDFIENVGYTDYEHEDAYNTLNSYGMEDNTCCWKGFYIRWKELVQKLATHIGEKNIQFSRNVVRILGKDNKEFLVETEQGFTYGCKKVIVATTISALRQLFPEKSIYQKEIQGQPFLRLYGKFTASSIPVLKEYVKGYTIVGGPLQKIIPMNPDKGIYMISYSDNNNALFMKKYLENTSANRDIICSLVEKALGIPKNALKLITIKDYYWPIGTHYYTPLNKKYESREKFIQEAQNPAPGILVVGEVVSENQGWTEGALESVQKVLTKKWVQTD
jgi:hypothetical protein